MEKINSIIGKIREFLDHTISIGSMLITIGVVVYLIYGLPVLIDKFFGGNKEITTVPNVTPGVIQEVTKENERTSERVFEEIQKSDPVVIMPPTATPEEIQRAIDELDGERVISAPNEKPGTSIYSIRIKRSQHGIGTYVDSDAEVGLHYRNKRWIYQVGINKDNDVSGRVAFELIQW